MRQILGGLLLAMLGLVLISPAIVEGAPDAAVEVVKKFDGGTAPAVGKKEAPTTIEGGIQEGLTLWEAIKAKAWWAVAGAGVFIVMLILQLTKVFDKLGKRGTWLLTGGLSLIAALLLAFDDKGFSWNTFVSFCSAGPTVAWLRGFVKKAVMNTTKKQE